ncbi:VF530 family DNA-binding protein [Gemmatimonas sp.]|jgi:uncharacterized protein (DUF2132 family)|uniref:VF530 family protein n=1 Tax=Gemmatimonas sp. TaxID=1962908 RepID=UPI0031CB9D74|nr:DUF2132 domain-containing protein [Gemmatimonas sp.]
MTDQAPSPKPKSTDPLHGVTLKDMVEHLAERYGWDGLGDRITIRCFTHDPTVNSSLKFLRKTPWARAKVESLYRHSVAHPRKQQAAQPSVPSPVQSPIADA